MIAAENKRIIRDVGQSMAFGDKTLEVVKEFVYLGSLVTPNNYVSLEIQRKNHTATRCFFGLRNESEICASFKSDKSHHLQDLDPSGPAVWQ
jgi:hypothetical protein